MKRCKIIRNQIFRLTHPGKKCYCVYCQKTYSRFMHEGVRSPVFKKYQVSGGGFKKNVRCPNCLSTDRSRLLCLFFKLRTDIFHKKTKILHVSPNAEVARTLCKNENIDYTCGAFEPERFNEFKAIKLDVTKIELGENLFDVVICNHVLEHVPEDIKAMREIYRVLKPNGFAVLQVPLAINLQKTIEDNSIILRKQRKTIFGQTDHIRLYGLDYFDKLRDVGFRVIRDNPFTNKWSDDLEKHCLDKIEDVIIAYKNQLLGKDCEYSLNLTAGG